MTHSATGRRAACGEGGSMTGFEEDAGAYPADDPSAAAEIHALDLLERIEEAQRTLRQDFAELLQGFERLAGHLGPLLTKQYGDTQARMRVLETRLRNRQERPLVMQMANLLSTSADWNRRRT